MKRDWDMFLIGLCFGIMLGVILSAGVAWWLIMWITSSP